MTQQTYIVHALAFLVVFFIASSIAASWPFHLMLLAVIIVTFLYQLRIGLAWAIAAGIFLDGFTVAGNGVWATGFIGAALAVHYLLQVWFPARSLISVALVAALGVVVFEVIVRTLGQLLVSMRIVPVAAAWSTRTPVAILIHMLWGIVLSMVVVGIIRSRNMRLRNAYLIR